MSHPSWVCGLKLISGSTQNRQRRSHPSWVCGLKLSVQLLMLRAPCHTLRGCVDWNKRTAIMQKKVESHTLRGCVDWNSIFPPINQDLRCHTLRGCVDWNSMLLSLVRLTSCHTLRGCVDWNSLVFWKSLNSFVTPFVGVWIETLFHFLPLNRDAVTPFVGVWIETVLRLRNVQTSPSHPSWVCGLKLVNSFN